MKKAGRIARVAELRKINLVEAKFTSDPHILNDLSGKRKAPSASLMVSVASTERASIHGNVIRARIALQLEGRLAPPRSPKRAMKMSCVFETEYGFPLEEKFSPAELRAFAHLNALMNVWPYWRELAQGMTLRAGLPPLIAPLLHIVTDQHNAARNTHK